MFWWEAVLEWTSEDKTHSFAGFWRLFLTYERPILRRERIQCQPSTWSDLYSTSSTTLCMPRECCFVGTQLEWHGLSKTWSSRDTACITIHLPLQYSNSILERINYKFPQMGPKDGWGAFWKPNSISNQTTIKNSRNYWKIVTSRFKQKVDFPAQKETRKEQFMNTILHKVCFLTKYEESSLVIALMWVRCWILCEIKALAQFNFIVIIYLLAAYYKICTVWFVIRYETWRVWLCIVLTISVPFCWVQTNRFTNYSTSTLFISSVRLFLVFIETRSDRACVL